MEIDEQLRLRALRILNDGYRHSEQAYAWAAKTTAPMMYEPRPSGLREELRKPKFTARELSLGAGEVVSL